ncbi:hypothetical protein V8C35DRAFT_278259 [Trichoderma chlorosporum]
MPTLNPHHHQSNHKLTKSLALLLIPILAFIPSSRANTEKVIFAAPPPAPASLAGLDAVRALPVLGPLTSWSVRTNLSRVFPLSQQDDDGDEQGHPSWLLLDNLTPGQRYELRVCWSALEPTAFTLDTYPLSTILSTPALLQSLTQHAKSIHQHQQVGQSQTVSSPNNDTNSALLLRVLAAADYFSHHPSLMKDPPPVLVDLILDPYLYNVLPQSLLPTVCYLVVVGVVSWFAAQRVAGSLTAIASPATNDQIKKQI